MVGGGGGVSGGKCGRRGRVVTDIACRRPSNHKPLARHVLSLLSLACQVFSLLSLAYRVFSQLARSYNLLFMQRNVAHSRGVTQYWYSPDVFGNTIFLVCSKNHSFAAGTQVV